MLKDRSEILIFVIFFLEFLRRLKIVVFLVNDLDQITTFHLFNYNFRTPKKIEIIPKKGLLHVPPGRI